MVDYKSMYIELLKQCDPRICTKCNNFLPCKGDKCTRFIEGNEGYLNGKLVQFHWTCEEFDWGDCPLLETTPCHNCVDNDYVNFELNEGTLEEQT